MKGQGCWWLWLVVNYASGIACKPQVRGKATPNGFQLDIGKFSPFQPFLLEKVINFKLR